jgi:hypothetical protein
MEFLFKIIFPSIFANGFIQFYENINPWVQFVQIQWIKNVYCS